MAAAGAGAERPDTLVEILRAAERYLGERGVDAPRRSAELLMGRVLGMGKLDLYLAHDRPLSEAERGHLRGLIGERGRGVPVAHLLGDWDFFGLELTVTKDVLVPRPETEHLVELAVELAPPNALCADLGTGSGAIGIALAVHRPDVRVVASDLDPRAAAVARRNVERHGVAERVRVVEGRDWEPLAASGPFDLLVSNPPYVDPSRPDLVERDVAQFEPGVALFSEPGRPASAYPAIVRGAADHLRAGAWLLLETGVGAAEPALELMRQAEFLCEAELRKDLAGHPRYLLARVRDDA